MSLLALIGILALAVGSLGFASYTLYYGALNNPGGLINTDGTFGFTNNNTFVGTRGNGILNAYALTSGNSDVPEGTGPIKGSMWANNIELTNYIRFGTNAVTANTIDASLGYQITNCSANPTFSGVAGVVTGKGISDVIVILANGSDRTVSVTAPNVHVYPSGTLTATNGSIAVLSVGGVGGVYTGAVFLAFP